MPADNKKSSQLINISTWTIIKVVFIILLLWFVYLIWNILAIIFVAILLTSLLQPAVDWLQLKIKLPRALGVILIYILVLYPKYLKIR